MSFGAMSSAGGRQPSQSRAIPTRTVTLSDGHSTRRVLPSVPSCARLSGWDFSQPARAVDKSFPRWPPLCQPGVAWPSPTSPGDWIYFPHLSV
uniref:Uncharacterized protein n=1 Tax=Malurus cyaneus samueli TaxID=2593467 RepID=A0A8C5U5X9_9PASS